MAQPVWLTPAGDLGTYPEGVFFQFPLMAEEPDLGDPVYYQVIAGELPAGVQVAANGLIVGIPKAIASVQGVPLPVASDITSRFAVRAYTTQVISGMTVINRLADRTFSITVTGQDAPEFVTPSGTIATVFDGTLITDLQVEYTDSDATDITIVRLAAGTLPPGTSISLSGLITGFVVPQAPNTATAGFSRDGQGFAEYPFDFPTQSNNTVYEFVLELTDGKASALRTFNIQVLSRDSLTADSTDITADNTFVTADGTPVRVPVLLTLPGSIGIVRSDNYFAFKFNGIQADGFAVVYATDSDAALAAIGLELDPGTGWLYGYIPNQGLQENTYNFKVRVYQSGLPDASSVYSDFSLTVQGPIDTEITWLTPASAVGRALVPSPLGTIVNGSTSQLYVEAVNASGVVLEYRLKSGSDSNLPQGLRLLPSGEIAGRCSFNTFTLDGGTTTFDVASDNRGVSAPTTFDLTFTFTVQAYSTNTQIRVDKVFSITVDRQYNEPYENLYIQAMPPQDDRDLVNSLLQNPTIIPPTLLYRGDDSNFGRATKVVYQHAFGLTAATYAEYVSSLYENHYWKNLVLGSIETAQATDDNGNVIYEVVYSRVIGGLTNDQGESVSKEVVLPYPIDPNTPAEVDTVFPNSLENMRNQVIDTVGQVSTLLPRWMLSTQTNGRVLGFTPAWVIAYVTPGNSKQIAYNIRTQFGTQLNLVDFEVDRYELDKALTSNWDPVTEQWIPQPPAETTFDANFDISGLYVSTSLVADATNGAVFDRSLTVNGILVVAAGAVGGQLAVPDAWVKKVGRSYQLLMDPDATGINSLAQQQMIRTLKGLTGTWHAGYQTAQRVGYGGGSSYTPNWLTDIGAASYAGYTDFLNQHAVNDMVWYKNNNGWNGTGIQDIEEVFEHIMHTIHLYGVRGGVQGSVTELNWDSENNPGTYTGTDLFKAMEEAIDNGMYDAGALDPYDSTEAHILMKEYMYLLNWGMWEMSVFWAGGSLAPEWNDLMRTPSGILANNPLGHALFEKYFAPVLSKPNFATLNSIFQDNDQGEAGYIATSAVTNETTFDGNSLRFIQPTIIATDTTDYDKYLVFPYKTILG